MEGFSWGQVAAMCYRTLMVLLKVWLSNGQLMNICNEAKADSPWEDLLGGQATKVTNFNLEVVEFDINCWWCISVQVVMLYVSIFN